MFENAWNAIVWILGTDRETLHAGHMAVRACIVFAAAIFLVRFGDTRFMGRNTAFDIILAIILGSVMSRAITGQSPFFATLAASVVLVALHWLLGAIAFRVSRFGTVVKGQARMLVEDGQIRWDRMKRSHISENDLLQALRINASLEAPDDVAIARLERSGDISIIPAPSQPRVVEIDVRDGVQRIRLEID
ncbi:hypothetical protein BH23CHL2_BH23CHL2_36670 [soil metagenome]